METVHKVRIGRGICGHEKPLQGSSKKTREDAGEGPGPGIDRGFYLCLKPTDRRSSWRYRGSLCTRVEDAGNKSHEGEQEGAKETPGPISLPFDSRRRVTALKSKTMPPETDAEIGQLGGRTLLVI